MTSPIVLDLNAARICDAIARIGYEPHTALMDLIDNAVTAGAQVVRVSLVLVPGKTLKNRNSVSMYQIIDNGGGMDADGIKNAFSLGANSNYQKNSLSKYGMGLKSAGLSLGSRISIVSKKGGKITSRFSFDRAEIEKTNSFVIVEEKLLDTDLTEYTKLLEGQSGTIVEIRGCEQVNHPSPSATLEKMRNRLGVVYFSFLSNTKKKLSMFTRAVKSDDLNGEFEEVLPKDMLFLDAKNLQRNWQPDNYDYAAPCLVLSEDFMLNSRNGESLPAIKVQAVAFPQASLSGTNSPLTPLEKQEVKSFEVSALNRGFFIYRNGRLIRWGDDVEGIISKDDINLRIRLDIDTNHDDVLHVDVTKQRLEIDDEHRDSLKRIVSKAIETAKLIREKCKTHLSKDDGSEGRGFTASTTSVPEDDPQLIGNGATPPVSLERQKNSDKEAKKVIKKLNEEASESANDKPQGKTTDDGSPIFLKIRYSEKVAYGQFWQPYHDAINGTFVAINTLHPFYQQVISKFDANSHERLAIEALIFSLGNAQNNITHNMVDVDQKVISNIFAKFHKNVDSYLGDWTSNNPEI